MQGVTREGPVREYEVIHDYLSWKPLCRVHRVEKARIGTSYFTAGIQITVVTGIVTVEPKWKGFTKCHGPG